MKKNFQIFWIKFKQFIQNPFYWNVAAAATSIVLTGIYAFQKQTSLAVIWGLCAGCEIYFASKNKKR